MTVSSIRSVRTDEARLKGFGAGGAGETRR